MSEPISRERALLGRVMADPALTLVTDTGKHVRPIWPVQCEQIPADPARHPGKVCTAALRVVDTSNRGAGPILVSLCDLTDEMETPVADEDEFTPEELADLEEAGRRVEENHGPHDHAFPLPDDYADPNGRPVDMALLATFIGAAFDGCTSCQDAELTRVVDDAATTARLVELACTATHAVLGGLPAGMTDPNIPSLSSKAFRRLARAGLDGKNDAMFALCGTMSVPRRREAANDAADILVGHLFMPHGRN